MRDWVVDFADRPTTDKVLAAMAGVRDASDTPGGQPGVNPRGPGCRPAVTEYVIDAAALVFALLGNTPDADDLRARLPGMRRHAPHLIDAEVGSVLRRHERDGRISGAEAEAALGAAYRLVDHRYPHIGALAHLAVPLLTADTRLSRTPGLPCRIEVV